MDFEKNFPSFLTPIFETFKENNHLLYLVGGSVRNLLLKIPVKDWDFTTDATPEEILAMFPDAFYDNVFGTVGIPILLPFIASEQRERGNLEIASSKTPHSENIVVEITTFRSESGYANRRHPETVSWGKSIEEDLKRRDFTINAIALNVIASEQRERGNPSLKTPHSENHTQALIDPFDGQTDLANKIIRAVGDPNERFKEDALRLLRAIRFAAQLEFTIENETWEAITKDAVLLPEISAERIREELMKIMESDHPYEGVMLLKNAHLLSHVLPELMEGIGVSQQRPGRHHTTDVFDHNVLSLKFCPSTDPIVRLATLLHDVGKPKVAGTDEEGFVTFYNHEIIGAKIARDICDRLHFSKQERQKIVNLIRWHMFTVDEHITDAAVRRFIRRVGVESVKDMMDLRVGERLGGGTQTAESWRLKLFKKRIEDQLAPMPFSINDLAIDGNDVMQILQIKPSKQVGELLQKLFEEVDEDLSKNTKEYLEKRLTEITKK